MVEDLLDSVVLILDTMDELDVQAHSFTVCKILCVFSCDCASTLLVTRVLLVDSDTSHVLDSVHI